MMTAVTNLTRLDWSTWTRGLIGAVVSGGAGSVASGFGATILDKSHDLNIFKLMAITFAFSAVISLAKFLQTTPVPEPPAPPAAPARVQ
jgi:zinc transporter ZupT